MSTAYLRNFLPSGSGSVVVATTTNAMLSEYTGTIAGSPGPHAPPGVEIAGAQFSLGGKIASDAGAPVTVSWSPELGATGYAVRVRRVVISPSLSETPDVAVFKTTGTSIRIPADVFTEGQFYLFSVAAQRTTNPFNGRYEPTDVPSQIADVASGMFRFGLGCGNGVADVGEDCDTAGESASCDVDCTTPMCSDGLRNASAGEACDTSADTASCDFVDCTLPQCGDNHVNRAIEDCDDGDAIDSGNGCGSNCKFNNICGNRTVESPVEDCDTGGDSDMCDANCTFAICGDGYVNAAHGERCDDANGNETDGCNTNCNR